MWQLRLRLLRRLRTDTAMCTFRIDELRQHSAEILLLGWHAEENALGAHIPVESFDIGNGEAQFDLSRWILVGSRARIQSTNPNSAMSMRTNAMQPISSRADRMIGTKSRRTVQRAATMVDREHDGHLHQFGCSRSDARDDPESANGSKDKIHCRRTLGHAMFRFPRNTSEMRESLCGLSKISRMV